MTARRVFDGFTFWTELEALELRFEELQDVVDFFVLVEATRTFTGKPKDLCFDQNRDRFRPWLDRVIHVVVEDDVAGSAWDREWFQRNAISRGLLRARADDIVMISDVDEIPSAESVREVRNDPQATCLLPPMHYYWLNCRLSVPLPGTAFVSYADLLCSSAQKVRENRWNFRMWERGWHFSYLGGVDRVQSKLLSFAHQEYNRYPYIDPAWIRQQIEEGRDLYGRENVGFPPEWVCLAEDSRYSDRVRSLAAKYPYLVNPRAASA